DYLIVNQDRHYGNYGAIRNAYTLEWLGLAPVFDSGTSLWHDTPTSLVHRAKIHSVPFKTSHEDQVKLIGSFDWLDFSILKDIDEVFRDILAGSPFIDSARRYALCRALARRVVMLQEYAERR
ncbi:MAG: excisionase, partial [Clostridiales bacterium]|nr:excisionase [Clostridiales bacterium]